jgi:hypothetical protein
MKKYIYIILIIILLYVIYKSVNSNVLTDYKDIKDLVVSIFNKNKFIYWTCGRTLDENVDLGIMETDINDLLKMENEFKNQNLGIVKWFDGYKIYVLNGKDIPDKDYKYPFINLFVYFDSDDKQNLKDLYSSNPIKYLNRTYPEWQNKASKTYDCVKHVTFEKVDFPIEYNKSNKPYLWQYWDGPKSSFITLSMKTVDINCSKSFNIVRLNKDNIYEYLPEMKNYEDKIKDILIAQKVDIYRIMLLYKYGGIYLDADTIVLRDPIDIMDNFKKYDFVGFGCTGNKCTYGYGEPSNWILASRPNSILMAKVLKNQLDQITNKKKFDYHDLGKLVIWKELKDLINNQDYEYFHYENKIDGSRDKYGNWINSNIVFSDKPIEYEDEDNMMFFVYYNSHLSDSIKQISENDLMNTNWNITKYLKKALKI